MSEWKLTDKERGRKGEDGFFFFFFLAMSIDIGVSRQTMVAMPACYISTRPAVVDGVCQHMPPGVSGVLRDRNDDVCGSPQIVGVQAG